MSWDNSDDDDDTSRIPLINRLFAKEKTRCIKDKNGFYACIDVLCENKNPFMCK